MKKPLLKVIIINVIIIIYIYICSILCINKHTTAFSILLSFLPFGFLIKWLYSAVKELINYEPWKRDLIDLRKQRKITSNTNIRISFAYLFRVKVDDKYFLVKNARGTTKYQPVGGAYKTHESELEYLKNEFDIVDDCKIPLDKSSNKDYRMFVKAKCLKKFVKRFITTKDRELISDLRREFIEEINDEKIIEFASIDYYYRYTHFNGVKWSNYFNCYELLIADIVEIILDDNQLESMRKLQKNKSSKYIFASEEEICKFGVQPGTNNLKVNIADHTKKILQGNFSQCEKIYDTKKKYRVKL